MGATRERGHYLRLAAIVVVGLVVLLYLGRIGTLYVFATEGDVPTASSLPLPSGSDVVGETIECGSGGCQAHFSVRPPGGMTPDNLADALGMGPDHLSNALGTPQARIAGSFWDPRTISMTSETQGQLLVITADFWSVDYSTVVP